MLDGAGARPAAAGQHRPARPLPRGAHRRPASGCAIRRRSRPSGTTCPASAAAFDPFREAAGGRGRRRLRRAGVRAPSRLLLRDGDLPPAGAGPAPPPARRRAAGPHPGPRAAGAPAGRTRRSTCSAWATTTRSSTATPAPIPAFLIDFARLFPGAADHPLEVNYRCPVAGGRRRPPPALVQRPPGGQGDPARAGGRRDPDALRVASTTRREDGAPAARRPRCRWLAEPGPTADGDRRAHPGQLPAARAPRGAGRGRRAGATRSCVADVLDRTGVRAALAYLRIGAAARGASPGDDLVEVYRRPQPGLPAVDPQVAPAAGRPRRAARPSPTGSTTPRWPTKVDRPRRRPARLVDGRRAAGTTRQALAVVRDGIGLGEAMGCSTARRAARAVEPARRPRGAGSRWPTCTPTRRTFEPWLRGVLHRGAGPTGASPCRPSTG